MTGDPASGTCQLMVAKLFQCGPESAALVHTALTGCDTLLARENASRGLEEADPGGCVQHPDQSANAFITSANTFVVGMTKSKVLWRSVFGQEASPRSSAAKMAPPL